MNVTGMDVLEYVTGIMTDPKRRREVEEARQRDARIRDMFAMWESAAGEALTASSEELFEEQLQFAEPPPAFLRQYQEYAREPVLSGAEAVAAPAVPIAHAVKDLCAAVAGELAQAATAGAATWNRLVQTLDALCEAGQTLAKGGTPQYALSARGTATGPQELSFGWCELEASGNAYLSKFPKAQIPFGVALLIGRSESGKVVQYLPVMDDLIDDTWILSIPYSEVFGSERPHPDSKPYLVPAVEASLGLFRRDEVERLLRRLREGSPQKQLAEELLRRL